MPNSALSITLLLMAFLNASASVASDLEPTLDTPDAPLSACVLDTLSSSLAALSPGINQVLQFVRGLDPKLVSMEKTPGWQDIEDLKKAIEQLKSAKLDLASQGRLEEARKWAIEAEKTLKADPKISAITSQVQSAKLTHVYNPGERALKRIYVKLLYALDRELPSSLRIPFKRLPIDPRRPKLLADARKLVSDLQTRFDGFYSTTGFSDDASLRAALNSMGGDYKKLLFTLDHDQYEFAMNRPEGARWWVPKVGFLNQRNTGSSRGSLNPNYRDQVEASLTGNKLSLYKSFDNELKPEYGYLKPTPDSELKQSVAASQYGTDVYIFKKDLVKDRVTWTAGDSFGVPRSMNNDPESPTPETWQNFFIPWKDRSLLVPFIEPKAEKRKLGFEAELPNPLLDLTPPPPPAHSVPALPSREKVLPMPPEPSPIPLPTIPTDAIFYVTFPPFGDMTPYVTGEGKLLLDTAPSSAVEAIEKWKEDYKATLASPAYKEYLKSLEDHKASEAYKAWEASELAYKSSPEMKAYEKDATAYSAAMSAYYDSDAYKAYMTSFSKLMGAPSTTEVSSFKGTPLEPFKSTALAGYIELQYFGPVTLDEVEIFEFRQNPPSGEFLDELKKRKIKIRDGRKDPAIEWKEGTP